MRMRRSPRERTYEFNIVGGVLERIAVFPDGHTYTHRCSLDIFEKVACAIEEAGSDGVTMEELALAINASATQVNIAMEFIKDRAGMQTLHRRNYPTCDCLFESAMAEWYYLAEAPDEAPH